MSLPPALPPALQAKAAAGRPAGPQVPFDQAAIALLEAYDAGRSLPPPPPLTARDQASYQWLRACAGARPGHPPANPFPPGPARAEAEGLRALFAATPTEAILRLPNLSLTSPGSYLGLWRWGKAQVRAGALDRAQRRAWEDRLLDGRGLDLVQGYAFRHALCFALAEKDEARLTALRAVTPEEQDDLYALAQTTFGLLGQTLPSVRLWTLPGLRLADGRLSDLGAPRVWIAPYEGQLPRIPPGCAWVVPTLGGVAIPGEAQLDEVSTLEAAPILKALTGSSLTGHLAPSRRDFERLGLVHFPILLRFDGEGRLLEVRMGDAAPSEPGF
jgi:hypothetical protein